jgi:hypothetical protein
MTRVIIRLVVAVLTAIAVMGVVVVVLTTISLIPVVAMATWLEKKQTALLEGQK